MPDTIRSRNARNDRRRHKRYPVNDRLFAIVSSDRHLLDRIENMSKGEIAMAIIKSKPSRMGEIVEISRSGLSFRYIATDRMLDHTCEMNILFIDKNFRLSRLPFQVMDDRSISSEPPFDVLRMRRFGVKFGGLTSRQKFKLDHLLKNYTSSGSVH